MSKNNIKTKKKLGRPKKHGAFSLMARPGTLPEDRRLTKYLRSVREKLIQDLAGAEEALTAGQEILIHRVIAKLAVCRVIEEYIREKSSILTGDGELQPILQKRYLSYNTSVRADLIALGAIKPDELPETVMSIEELVEKVDRENEEKAK